MKKIMRTLAGAVLLSLVLCLMAPVALAAEDGAGSLFPSNNNVFPEGSRISPRWLTTTNPGGGKGKSTSDRANLQSSWGDSSYFDDRTMPWGSGRFGYSWGDSSYFDDRTMPWGSGRFGSSWGDQSYFDDDTRRPWGSGRFGSSWSDPSYFDDDTRPWGSGHFGYPQSGKTEKTPMPCVCAKMLSLSSFTRMPCLFGKLCSVSFRFRAVK